ncbi:hypothetical protein [Magnetococcus sp. PR-3]|uniref:hypothetical protein n=1 Tax=Magnetococcus sp. PR-3 TaxID=3120355 RepID=UPI002FCE3B33
MPDTISGFQAFDEILLTASYGLSFDLFIDRLLFFDEKGQFPQVAVECLVGSRHKPSWSNCSMAALLQ